MTSALKGRPGWLGALVVAMIVATVLTSSSLAYSGASGGTSRATARRLALAALGVSTRHGAEIVFGLPAALPAGSEVRSAGPSTPAGDGAAAGATAPLVARARGAAWFFYDDLAPFQNYEHAGRVALVDVRTGKVTLSGPLSWAPAINGSLPAFLASPEAYASPQDHVFYRPYTGGRQMIPGPLAPAADVAARGPRFALDPAGATRAAAILAAEHSCTVRASDTLPGGYYGFGRYAQTRAGLYYRFQQLGLLNRGFHSAIYTPGSSPTLPAFVSREIARDGCRDMLLYLVGGGYTGQTAVNIGMLTAGGRVRHQDVTPAALRGLIAGHPHTTFELVIDAPHAAGFHALSDLGNVRVIATPSEPGGGSFTYVPNAEVGGRLVANDTNPLKLLQFTDRLLFGFSAAIATPCEVNQAASDGTAGGTALAYLVARGFAHGGPVDFPTRAGFGTPGSVQTLGFSAAPPPCSTLHQPPVLAGVETSPLAVHAGQAPAAVTSTITVSDPDSATLAGATVRISSGLVSSEDALGFAGQNGITGAYNNATGVLTLTGTASLAAYQTALRSVTYADSNRTSPSTASRTISFQVDDGAATNHLSNVVSRQVGVGPYPAPTANSDTATTDENTAIDVPVLANDTDPNGGTLSVASVDTAGTKGLVSINSNGTIHYDPNGQFAALNAGQQATDTFSYRATNGFTQSAPATVTVTITGVDNAPVLSGIESSAVAYHAGTAAVPVTSTLTASDVDNASLAGATVAVTSGLAPAEDALSFADQNGITGSYNSATGVLTLTGTASLADYQTALRSVTYSDTNGVTPSTATRAISFTVSDGSAPSNTVSRNVTVAANQAPTANDDTARTDKSTAIDIPVLSNDTDPQGYPLSVAAVNTTGTKGAVSINPDGTIHYDPNGQFNGLQQGQSATDTFTYTAFDGYHDSGAATVTVTITGVNDPPVLANVETSALQYAAGTPPVPVTQTLTITNPHGATLVGATVMITSGLVPSEDGLGFTSQNGITGSYDASTGVLTLTGTASVADYQAALRSITFVDPNGTNPSTGSRTVSFTVDDGAGSSNLSNTVARVVKVNPNSPPVAGDVNAGTFKHTAIDINVLSSASDPNGDPLSVASVDTTGTKGAVSINPDGTIHYDPNGQFDSLNQSQSATDTFTYKVTDGFHESNSATVTVKILGVNDPPVISNVETSALSYRAQDPALPVSSTLRLSDDDDDEIDGATVAITGGFNPSADRLSFMNTPGITGTYDAATGVLNLTGFASVLDYQDALLSVYFSSQDSSASPATRTVSFTVTDSLGATNAPVSRSIAVSAANQPPVAGTNDFTNVVGNTTFAKGTNPTGPAAKVSGSLLDNATDPDSQHSALTVTGNTSPSHGTVTVNSDGTFTYLPSAGYTGSDSFTYTISDNDPTNPKTTTGTVNLTVGPLVWYVDDSLTSAGDGRSTSPFNSLAAANAAVGAGDIVFLYQGSAAYTGGTAMKTNEQLLGQPNGLTVNGYGLVAASGSNPTITNGAGDGIDLAAGADLEAVDVSGASGNGIAAASVGQATVGGNGIASVVSSSGSDGIHVAGGSGAMTLNANVSGSAGHSVLISGRAGGTVTLPGTISDSATGVALSGNTGATINFSGKITASTGANPAFSATGGGTVSATGSGSTLATTTASALNVSSTTIGSSGLTFQSISAGTSASGPTGGINLSSTGTSGGLTVTGSGTTAGSGGTIQKATEGINLSSTSTPSFTDMVIKNNSADGINGSQVNGLTLAGSTVSGNGTQANVSGANNDGLDFSPNGTGSPNGLTGTVSITNSTITGSADNNAIISDSSGTLNLTVTGSTFSSNNGTTGNDGLHVDANGTTNATVSVTGSTFTNNFGDHFQFSAGSTATGTNGVTFSNNTLTSSVVGVLGGGVVVSPGGNGSTTLAINNNNIQLNPSTSYNGIAVDNGSGGGTISGTISGNTVGNPSVANSGSGFGIGIYAEGSETETLAITNNKLSQYHNAAGINLLDREGHPTMNLTITGNTISHPGSFGSWGILGTAGATSGPPADSGTVCLAFGANAITGSGQASQGGADVELDQSFDANVKLPGYTGGVTDTAAVQTYLQGKIGGGPSAIASANAPGPGDGFQGATSCPTPS